jgi:hypothetical protein
VLDWKKIVREKLGSLPLETSRQDEIVEELAQQLEAAYQEELAHGVGEVEAVRRSLRQFQDWESLRRDVFESVGGARLPVWQLNTILSPRRLPVWIALAVSLAFLALPSFRKALQILPLTNHRDAWSSSAFSEGALKQIEKSQDKQKYARTLAYVALHSPDSQQAAAAAEKAVALDPQLTWICAKLSHANYLVPGYDPTPWINRLKAWDPGNAYVYLLEAGAAVHSDWEAHWAKFSPVEDGELRRALVADPRWRIPMEKAFSAQRMDMYTDRQFLLDREVLLERGLDRPEKLLIASANMQLPDFTLVQMYVDHLALDVAESEEKAGHLVNALAIYQDIVSFGYKLQSRPTSVERMFSTRILDETFQKMAPLLRREGRNAEANAVESALAAARAEDPRSSIPAVPAQQSPAQRSGQMVMISGFFLLLCAAAAAVWLICVALLRTKPNLSRSMNWMASCLGWAPLLLPLSCLGLFLSFFPYSRSIAGYSSAGELIQTYDSLLAGVYILHLDPFLDIWIDHMFWPLIWCSAIMLLGAAYLSWMARQQCGQQSGLEGKS